MVRKRQMMWSWLLLSVACDRLAQHTRSGMLTIFTAHTGENLVGIATSVAVPASLRLSSFWQLRDLYVVPGARRHGAGRALVSAVRAAASAAGAIRVSVQAETGNAAARKLYHSSGLLPVEGLQVLSLDLPSASPDAPIHSHKLPRRGMRVRSNGENGAVPGITSS